MSAMTETRQDCSLVVPLRGEKRKERNRKAEKKVKMELVTKNSGG